MRAAALKLLTPALAALGTLSEDSITGTIDVRMGFRLSQSGLSVATTKSAASKTVTDWANTSQSRFMGVLRVQVGGVPQVAPARIVPHIWMGPQSSTQLTQVNAPKRMPG